MSETIGHPSDARLPIPRRAHTKSKTGCRSCKVRKVKCDERRPLCLNCERHFKNYIACDFDDQNPVLDPGVAVERDRGSRSQPAVSGSSGGQPRRYGRDAEVLAVAPGSGVERIDPFEITQESEQPGPNEDILIGHYLSDFAYRSFPLYANKSLIELWWPFVREDDLLFHVILLLTSLDRQRLQHRPDGLHTRRLLDQCLTLLNQRIRDPEKSASDHTLAAIAALLAMESERGNIRGVNMHMEGLKRMVEIRGGLDAVRRTNAMAANFVYWYAMLTINEPSFLPLPLTYGDDLTDEEWLHNAETATLLTHGGEQAKLEDYGVDVVTANVLHKVQILSKSYMGKLEYDSPREAIAVLSNLCSILQQLLRLSRTSSSSSSHDSPVPGLSQSCRLAGCLHLFTPQAGYFPDPTLLLHTLVRDLKGSLTHMIHATGTQSALLLWLLSVGGVTAHAMMPERAWFVGHLVVVVTDLRIRTWEVMRESLIRLAFHDNFCDLSFHALWEEVMAKQEVFMNEVVVVSSSV